MRYYFKQVSEQDKSRTAVINEAATDFFNLHSLVERDSELTINVRYRNQGDVANPTDNTDNELSLFSDKGIMDSEANSGYFTPVKIVQKQDKRIFIDRELFDIGDVWVFENMGNNKYAFDVIKPHSPKYKVLINSLKRGCLITNSFPLDNLYKEQAMNLNTILFGPPGTGKTDATVEKALEVLEMGSVETDDRKRREENREVFRTLLNKRIFFVTMHPSYSYEDFVQGIKPKVNERGELIFDSKSGIFKIVSDLARKMFDDEGETIDSEVDNKDILRLCFFLSKFNTKTDKKANKYFGSESNGEVFAIVGNRFGANPNSIKNHRDKFDFLTTNDRKGWQPNNGSSDKLDNTANWPYHDIYLELKDKSFEEVEAVIHSIEVKRENKVRKTEDNINYVLILDEINRANISKVFGELITLLEEDKRIGNENELSVTLPSGEAFSVPPNLYIIGTMNTADKSIALVDLALRRRFQFIPVYPQPEIVEKFAKFDNINKMNLMIALNKQLINPSGKYYKGVDFQIGHAYFLKDNSVADIINENILPLLTEYFRNDLEKVKNLMSDIGKPLDEKEYENTGLLKFKV